MRLRSHTKAFFIDDSRLVQTSQKAEQVRNPIFDRKDMKFKEEITTQARKFSKAMKAPLIYCSSSHSINIKKIFQLILANVFHLRPKVAEIKKISEPLVEYKATWKKRKKSKKSGPERKEDR